MTIRSGKRPRDPREFQARPFDPDAYATDENDPYGEPPRRNRGGGGGSRGSGLMGLVKFLVFALVLAGVVLIARPDRVAAGRQQRGPRCGGRTIPRPSSCRS